MKIIMINRRVPSGTTLTRWCAMLRTERGRCTVSFEQVLLPQQGSRIAAVYTAVIPYHDTGNTG